MMYECATEKMSLSQKEGNQQHETATPACFSCPICYDTCSLDEESSSSSIEIDGCGHKFCRECLVEFCRDAILCKEIPISCPALCSNKLEEQQVRDVLLPNSSSHCYGSIQLPTPEEDVEENSTQQHQEYQKSMNVWRKFKRYQSLHQNPDLIECSGCQQLYCSEENKVSERTPSICQCPSCDKLYCKVHGDAHSGQTCAEYETSVQAQKDLESEIEIRKFTKPCSHCTSPIQKASGCDHIVCPNCHEDMCYKCGTHLYLTGTVLRSCEQCSQSYLDHRYGIRYRLFMFVGIFCYIPFCLLWVIVMSVLAILSCCFCGFCGCGKVAAEAVERKGSKGRPMTDEASDINLSRGVRAVLFVIFLPLLDLFGFGVETKRPLEER